MNEPPNTSDPHGLESGFLDLWLTLEANRCDLKKLPQGIASHPILKNPTLTRLFDLLGKEHAPALHTALEQALGITTHNQGIALQMWWSQVAWLKRRLMGCSGIDWQTTDITRRPIPLEQLLTAYQHHSPTRQTSNLPNPK